MFPRHNPAQQAFSWYCEFSGATQNQIAAAAHLRTPVKRLRNLYRQPVGRSFPYDNLDFKFAYLMAYFPAYIEPLYHTLSASGIDAKIFNKRRIKASIFGGGPCPELLGMAAFLRKAAPDLAEAEITVFDRETSWQIVQKTMIPNMLPAYASPRTSFSINSRTCNVVDCFSEVCDCGVYGSDLIIAQNFLTELYANRERAIKTFEGLIQWSGCRYLIFVDNHYDETKAMMSDIAKHLHSNGFAKTHAQVFTDEITPNIELPEILAQHLFTGEDGLIARKHVKFHRMVIEIAR